MSKSKTLYNHIRCHKHIESPYAGSCKQCLFERMRYEIKDNLNFDDWRNPQAITVTFKQSLLIPGSTLWERITPSKASEEVYYFLNVLNGKLQRRSDRQKGYRIGTFATMEYGFDDSGFRPPIIVGRLHYHCAIECPRADLIADLPEIVADLWSNTRWGYNETCTKPCDAGWFDYMMKSRTKHDFIDSIDPYAWQPPKLS